MRSLTRILLGLILCLLPMLGGSDDALAQVGSLACPPFQTAVSTTANGNACGVGGYNTLTFQISATTMGSVVFEGTVDGTNYVALVCMNTPGLVYQNGVSAVGVYHCSVKNFAQARARISGAGTAISITGYATTLSWGTGAF